MFLFRVRPPAPARRCSVAAAALVTARLYTTRPVAADFASHGTAPTRPVPTSPGTEGDGADAKSPAAYMYLKQQDVTPEPRVSPSGTRTYVVSPKESAPYDVPGGAYGSSDPYLNPPPTPAPQTSAPVYVAPGAAHATATAHVPHRPDGESADVRFRTAGSPTYSPNKPALADRSAPHSKDAGLPRQE